MLQRFITRTKVVGQWHQEAILRGAQRCYARKSPGAPSYISMHSVSPIRAVVRFGVFEADVYSGELRKNGVKVKIQDLPFRALKLFLSNPNEVLSRDRFRRELW